MTTKELLKTKKSPIQKTFAKKNSKLETKKKPGKGNWKQRLKRKTDTSESKKKTSKFFKKSLQYILLLKKWKNEINYTNLLLLKAFLTKYSKIKPRRKTRIDSQKQRKIAKSIRKARVFGLIPFTSRIELKT